MAKQRNFSIFRTDFGDDIDLVCKRTPLTAINAWISWQSRNPTCVDLAGNKADMEFFAEWCNANRDKIVERWCNQHVYNLSAIPETFEANREFEESPTFHVYPFVMG